MSIKFNASSKGAKTSFKKAAPFVAASAVVAVILSVLILPDRIMAANQTNTACSELGIGGGWSLLSNTCDKSFDEIIFVVGDTANTPKPNLNYPDYVKYAFNRDVSASGIYAMSVSRPSKNPKAIDITKNNEGGEDDKNNENDISKVVGEHINNMSARQDGADYLEAIRTAARFANNKERTLIYVIGSGLSDRGYLDFAHGNLLMSKDDAETIAEQVLDKLDSDGELGAVTIIWDGIGEVTAPQADLSSDSVEKLTEIYQNVLEGLTGSKKSNADILFRESGKMPENSVETDYKVDTTRQKVIISKVFGESETSVFQFLGGRSDFVDTAATQAEINKIVGTMKESPTSTATITVYVSRGENCLASPDEGLIKARLDRIQQAFAGIESSRLNLVNGGFGPEHECNGENRFISEEIARKNRKVEIKVEEQ